MTETGSGCAGKLRGGGHAAGSQGLHRGEARLRGACIRPMEIPTTFPKVPLRGMYLSFYVVGVVESFATT